jgi:hypothetical protein
VEADEEVLADQGVTRVVRVGSTVRRPVRPFTATVQTFLVHLWGSGVRCIPEPLGYDEQGREVLSYLDGDVPAEPLPDWATADSVLVGLAEMIRALHEAAAGWQPPADAIWGRIPGRSGVVVPPLFDTAELVAHSDYCPGNVVFRDRRPAALIDFDLARPTTRVVDFVNPLYWWTPLVDPRDRPGRLSDTDVFRRCRVFADAYGMTRSQRKQIADIAVRGSQNNLITMRAAADADPVFRRWWDEGVRGKLERGERWTAAHATDITAALLV